uniref:NADH-ubiquinone oxidoreductase chain 2 n=2 Tax=Trichoferus campestris TaxID=351093 RepID=A0A343ERG1_9CUCU|nr:NADH dehydrogenase subunit 2 [Trichoferus campestris]QWB85729.1 NADH dehydrogenase subunit 2 [Trichoferus campestris]
MNKFYKILFFNSLVIGTLITISSYSWFSMWMGLEINLLSFIPLMSKVENIYPSESAIKYFITQSMASSILLFAIIMMMNVKEFIPQNSDYSFMMILNSALFIKMGAAPFHAWLPEVIEGLDWLNCLIMLTWQKIAPLTILTYNSKTTLFLSSIVIASTIIGSIQGLNQNSIRKILAYSSINHMGWMIASIPNSKTIWMVYFIVYVLISINIITLLMKLNLFQMSQLFYMSDPKMNMNIMVSFFSLGGLPPFLGFLPKWMTIYNLIYNKMYFLSLILIIFSLVTTFFYLRIAWSAMMLNCTETLYQNTNIKSMTLSILNLIMSTGIIFMPLMINPF